MSDIRCPTCYSTDVAWIGKIPASNRFAGKELEEPLGRSGLYKCKVCHLWFRYPRLPKIALDKLDRLTGKSARMLLFNRRVQKAIEAGEQIALANVRRRSQFFLDSNRCLEQMG